METSKLSIQIDQKTAYRQCQYFRQLPMKGNQGNYLDLVPCPFDLHFGLAIACMSSQPCADFLKLSVLIQYYFIGWMKIVTLQFEVGIGTHLHI